MLIHIAAVVGGLMGSGPASAQPAQPSPPVTVDVSVAQVVVTIGPLDVATGMHYHQDSPDEHVGFTWPADGWIQGYRIDLVDASGHFLPHMMLHHVGVADLSRRQLASPIALRLFAVGHETEPVRLPSWMGVPVSAGEELITYYAVVNESDTPVEGASIRITLAWRPANADVRSTPTLVTGKGAHPSRRFREWRSSFTEVVPIIFNADPNQFGQTKFDVGLGVSTVSMDVVLPLGGFLRAVGGHMHDYATEMRLEDAETGEVLVRLEADVDDAGRIQGVEEKHFPFMLHGIRLDAGRHYTIVSVYDNPTGSVLPKAGMAYMGGVFIPDDLSRWPEVDAQDPRYRHDVAGIMGERATVDSTEHGDPTREGLRHSH